MLDDDADVPPYYCISQLRCRLCQFSLEECDPVVACALFRIQAICCICIDSCSDIDGGRRLSRFSFHQYEPYYDPILRIKFHVCSSACGSGNSYVFHGRCFDFSRNLYPVTPTFLAVTEISFQPSSCESQRRQNLIRSLLPSKLLQALPIQLPYEILTMIAEFLIYECAVVTAQEQTLKTDNTASVPSEFSLDLTRNVYAQYRKFDGVIYLKNLLNSQSEKGKYELLLLDVKRISTICKILVAEDHLGIRSIQFASSDTGPEPCPIPGAWWTDITRLGGITKIRVKSDVSEATACFYSQS